jgi:hypothetical protein
VPDNSLDNYTAALANTTLTDRELIIHLLQHIEMMYEQVAETHGAVMRIDGQLSVFAPLLDKLAPGGRPDMISMMQTRRGFRRGTQG